MKITKSSSKTKSGLKNVDANIKLEFKKKSPCLYVSASGYEIIKSKNLYYICLNNTFVNWQTGFSCVEAAQNFLNSHNYIKATASHIDYSTDDLEFVLDNYNFEPKEQNYWVSRINNIKLTLHVNEQSGELNLNVEKNGTTNTFVFSEIDDLILELDNYFGDAIFDTVSIIDSGSRESITAASVRDIAKNLVRVKSSNIWAYGINIKDAKSKVGDVVVQFKGLKGGPGDCYEYYDVPIALYRKWLSYPSKGHFFWKFIRNNFLYRKLTGDKRGKLKNAINN